MDYEIEAVCKGACGGTQALVVRGSNLVHAQALAAMLDGSFFPVPPDAESQLGKCGVCKGALVCTVREAAPAESAP